MFMSSHIRGHVCIFEYFFIHNSSYKPNVIFVVIYQRVTSNDATYLQRNLNEFKGHQVALNS